MSILLPNDLSAGVLLEEMEQDPALRQQAYDTERLPGELIDRVRESQLKSESELNKEVGQ
jgi:hypothetical protein